MVGRKQSGDTTRHSFFDTRLPAERFGGRVWCIRAMCASVLPFQNPIFYDFDIFITIILIQLSSHFFSFRHSHSFRHNPHHSTPPSLLPPSRSLFVVIFNCLLMTARFLALALHKLFFFFVHSYLSNFCVIKRSID